MRRKISAVCATVVVAVLLAIVGVSPAQAASPIGTPKGSNPRQFMLNVLGSMLGPLAPESWKREQIAYTQRYNHGWETLEKQFGTDPANPDYMGSPDSYNDYVIRKQEQSLKGGTSGGKMKAPATKPAKFVKTVGGVAGAITAAQVGFSIGEGISDLFGLDIMGGICEPNFEDFGMIAALTSTDCTDFWNPDASFDPNVDATSGVVGSTVCNPSNAAQCFTLVGETVQSPFASVTNERNYCFNLVGTSSAPVGFFTVRPGGASGWENTTLSTSGAGAGLLFCTGARSAAPYLVPAVPGANSGVNVYWGPRDQFAVTQYRWGTVGPATPVVTGSADPERTLTCTIEGDDGHTYTAESEPFKESDGAIAPPECPPLPDGVAPTNVKVTESSPTGPHTLADQDVTDEYLDWWDSYPECRTGACKLDLIDLTNPSYPVSCFDLDDSCEDWFTSPSKVDDYECHYGIHTVELSECNVYSGVFKSERLAVGAPYSDPMTGTWSGGQNAPNPDEQALGQTIQDPAVARACRGMDAIGFDPVAWVMRPIQCALEWAFVPRTTVVQMSGAQLSEAFNERAPGQLATLIGSWSFNPTMSGCRRTYTYDPGFGKPPVEMEAWNVCPGSPLEPVAVISRWVILLGVIVLVAVSLRRSVAGTVDYKGQ